MFISIGSSWLVLTGIVFRSTGRHDERVILFLFFRYLQLFVNAMRDSEKSDNLGKRLAILNDYFTFLLYCNISRSLFEKDKMLLSFLLCTTLWKRFGKLEPEEFTFFATGGISTGSVPPNPTDWLPEKLWVEMLNLSKMKNFAVSL